ncbi:MAG: HD domain-containing protein [Clostridiales bacterium]|nr:HD domain-containing protein [Clostridiales bacterium]
MRLSESLQSKIKQDRKNGVVNPNRCDDSEALRRDADRDKASLWRPAFVRDTEKILHLPYYNRYADKTQVFSFYNNDDITRRALHVQLVSRIARNIGAVLGLNLDLIEAISLGHDIGHTPFGHAGERFLSQLLYKETGRYFNHNVHSVRALDKLFSRNITLQTLDGALCHNGEFEQMEYKPAYGKTFDEFDKETEDCYVKGKSAIEKLVPSTLEGCVVRICDMIAYLGKDRQDARIAKIIDNDYQFESGMENSFIINNLTVDIIENSYGKDYILLSKEAYNMLKSAKLENNRVIYQNEAINSQYNEIIKPMFSELYYKLLNDIINKNEESIIYRHHIKFILQSKKYYSQDDYLAEEPNQIVADFIASMTDDYFIALHEKCFPNSKYKIKYKSYFSSDKKTF